MANYIDVYISQLTAGERSPETIAQYKQFISYGIEGFYLGNVRVDDCKYF